MKESSVQQRIRLAAAKAQGHALWRNNSGACLDQTGRMIRYGLGNDSEKINRLVKSSDLIGITPLVITHHHIGMTIGVFTAVEVKASDWRFRNTDRERAQNSFLTTVNMLGGRGGFVRNEEDYWDMLR